jgi:hypothetical protein
MPVLCNKPGESPSISEKEFMLEQDKIAVFEEFLDDEASVVEIARALSRQTQDENLTQLQDWIAAYAIAQARQGSVGFYVDEFGARDTRECTWEEAQALLTEGKVWSIHNETMLHVFRAD